VAVGRLFYRKSLAEPGAGQPSGNCCSWACMPGSLVTGRCCGSCPAAPSCGSARRATGAERRSLVSVVAGGLEQGWDAASPICAGCSTPCSICQSASGAGLS